VVFQCVRRRLGCPPGTVEDRDPRTGHDGETPGQVRENRETPGQVRMERPQDGLSWPQRLGVLVLPTCPLLSLVAHGVNVALGQLSPAACSMSP
jgi:hypothetical protein